jgi:pimeloyl-ACP methyl ester carboxylesterase
LSAQAPVHCSAKGLALLEPVTVPHEPPFLERLSADNHPLVERTLHRRIVWDSREQLFAAYKGKDAFAAWREDVLWDYVNHGTYELPDGGFALKCSAEVEAQVFATTMSFDIFSQVDKIDCPVLVLRGEHTDVPLLGAAGENRSIVDSVASPLPRRLWERPLSGKWDRSPTGCMHSRRAGKGRVRLVPLPLQRANPRERP